MEFEVCIFRKEKVVVVYRADSKLRLYAIILNGREVEPDKRFKVDQRKLLKLVARLSGSVLMTLIISFRPRDTWS